MGDDGKTTDEIGISCGRENGPRKGNSGQSGDAAFEKLKNVKTQGTKFEMLDFYLLDIFDDSKNPGFMFLFGKLKSTPVQGYSSCCVVVKNLTRKIFLLPRKSKDDGTPVEFQDVYTEFDNVISRKYKITSFQSRKVNKKYGFDFKNAPAAADYLEIRYSGLLPPLPQGLKGGTFSRAFGKRDKFMETYLMENGLKGPRWLQISNCQTVLRDKQESWSKFEFTCNEYDVRIHPQGQNLPPPPLILVSLNIQYVNDASSKKDSIIFAGVAVNKNFSLRSPLPPSGIYDDFFCLLNKPPGGVWPPDMESVVNERTLKMHCERSMLGCLLAKLHQLDPNVIVSHDLNFKLLMRQLWEFKVPHWSRIGRLKRSTHVTKDNKILDFKAALAGRLLCDVKVSAMELIRSRSYDLLSVGVQVLGMKEDQIGTLTDPEMKELFNSSEGLRRFVYWGINHCVMSIQLINKLQVPCPGSGRCKNNNFLKLLIYG